jgi:hypothetical protein
MHIAPLLTPKDRARTVPGSPTPTHLVVFHQPFFPKVVET